MARKLTFTHPRTGKTYERTTDADYSHISIKGGEAKWHKTKEAANRRGGEVHAISDGGSGGGVSAGLFNDRRPDAGATCTSSTSDGKCGKPAVTSWTSKMSGETYHECREHKAL